MPHRAFDRLGGGSPAARLAVAAGIVWLAVAVAVVFLLVREREATIERASRNFAALALALESHTARTFQAVDLTLAGAVDALRLADDLPPYDPEFQTALERRLEFLTPYVRAIYIVNADGEIIHHTDYPATPALEPARQAYFRRHRQNPALVGFIAAPLKHPGLGWFVPVTRRLGSDGEFEGIAVAAVQPRYFEALYQRMGLGTTDYISLFYENGVLISQYPEAGPASGTSFASTPLFALHLPRSDAGSFITAGPPLPFERLVSYRAVQGHPLVVAVAEETGAVLAPWRAMATGATIGLAALFLLLALLVEQVRRQERVRERAQEQQAKTERMRALGHLTSGVAHDFNNLLGVISSSLAVITHEAGDRDARRNAAAAAERAVGRGAELIRRLGTFARSRPMQVEPAQIDDCIRDCEDLLRRAAGRHVDLLIDLTPGLPPCRLDETEFEVALVNLVVNARDAMAGSGRIAIRTYACSDTRDRVCVSVEDSGHGMSDAVQQHAFEPYYTTKGEQGTGLGLAQVYGFMLQIGGEARILSRPGIGTKVELLFPVAPSAV